MMETESGTDQVTWANKNARISINVEDLVAPFKTNVRDSINVLRNTLIWVIILSILWAAAAIISGCRQQETSATETETKVSADLGKSIGWIHGNCLAIKNNHLKEGIIFTMITLGESQELHDAKILHATSSPETCAALKEGRKEINLAQGYSFYEIASTPGSSDGLALGIIVPHPVFSKNGPFFTGDINGDGRQDYATQCATSEGIQFNVWSETIYAQEPLWSGYYYLDYATDPTCP